MMEEAEQNDSIKDIAISFWSQETSCCQYCVEASEFVWDATTDGWRLAAHRFIPELILFCEMRAYMGGLWDIPKADSEPYKARWLAKGKLENAPEVDFKPLLRTQLSLRTSQQIRSFVDPGMKQGRHWRGEIYLFIEKKRELGRNSIVGEIRWRKRVWIT